jgi:hypothetical protein
MTKKQYKLERFFLANIQSPGSKVLGEGDPFWGFVAGLNRKYETKL